MSKSASERPERPTKRAKKFSTTVPEQFGGSRLGFLDLPAELRNWVYDYVAQDDDPQGYPPALHYRPTTGTQNQYASRRTAEGNTLRQGFGLTQSCRLIRYEYLPIYQSHARVSCSYHSLRACCVENGDSGTRLSLPLGKMNVEYRMKVRKSNKHGRPGRPVYDASETDLLAIIRAAQHTPDLQLEFFSSAGSTDISPLFDIQNNQKWSKCLDDQIHRIRMLPESIHRAQTIAIEVKVDHTERWMTDKVKSG